jgi:predicted amidohydrolase
MQVAACAGWAKREGASMLLLPECFGFMGESGQQTVEEADPPVVVGEMQGNNIPTNDGFISSMLETAVESAASGETPEGSHESTGFREQQTDICILAALKTIAKVSGLWLSGGGMHVAGAPPAEGSDLPRVYNTHVIIDDQGTVKVLYRKIHLFDVHIPDKVNLQESATTAPGTELAVCDTPIGVVGLTTCYDVRFPEMYIPLVNNMGAQVLLVPSAFTVRKLE